MNRHTQPRRKEQEDYHCQLKGQLILGEAIEGSEFRTSLDTGGVVGRILGKIEKTNTCADNKLRIIRIVT
jgi:hypothetical protein